MGTDKARLALGERTLIEHALDSLQPLVERTFLASGSEPRYAELGRPIVLDRGPAFGPLAGLEAGLAAALDAGGANALVCVLACDMPFASTERFEALLVRRERDELDACVAQSVSGSEPLFAVYSVRLLAAVRAALNCGERRMNAFERFAVADGSAVRVGRLALLDLEATNLNTQADLAAARARFGDSNKRASA